MSWYSGAKKAPVKNFTTNGQEAVHGLVVHIMQGTLAGSRAWFNNPSSQDSAHFGTSRDGDLEQWVDTKDRAWAQAAGNRTWLSIENEGFVPDALTGKQLEKVAQVFAWVVRTYPSIPYRVANSPSERGLGWHGMGGAAWGGHTGCPGDHIKAQLQKIVDRAKEINGAKPAPVYAPFPGAKYFYYGRTSGLITELGKALVRAGYKGYRVGPGPVFTPADKRGVKWFQEKQGWSGSDADGIPGPVTWKRLKVAQPK